MSRREQIKKENTSHTKKSPKKRDRKQSTVRRLRDIRLRGHPSADRLLGNEAVLSPTVRERLPWWWQQDIWRQWACDPVTDDWDGSVFPPYVKEGLCFLHVSRSLTMSRSSGLFCLHRKHTEGWTSLTTSTHTPTPTCQHEDQNIHKTTGSWACSRWSVLNRWCYDMPSTLIVVFCQLVVPFMELNTAHTISILCHWWDISWHTPTYPIMPLISQFTKIH